MPQEGQRRVTPLALLSLWSCALEKFKDGRSIHDRALKGSSGDALTLENDFMKIICQLPSPDSDTPFGLDELGRGVPNPCRESQPLLIKNPWKQALIDFPGSM